MPGSQELPRNLAQAVRPPFVKIIELATWESDPATNCVSGSPFTGWVAASRWRSNRSPGTSRCPIRFRGRRPHPGGFTLHGRKTENSNLRALRPPLAFQAVAAPWRLHLPCEEGGRLERHGVTRASLSGRARRPGRFTFHGAAGGDRRTARYAQTGAAVIPPPHCVRREGFAPSHPFRDTGSWDPRVCIPPPAHGVTDRIRTGPLTLARSDASR